MYPVDRTILSLVQDNARISAAELAHHTGVSSSTCLRRLRALQRDGVIAGFHARVDPAALGFSTQVTAFITLGKEDRDTVAAREAEKHLLEREDAQVTRLPIGAGAVALIKK